MTSKLDAVYRSFLITKFFTKGWGKPENLRRLFEFRKIVANRDECLKLIERDYPVTITKDQRLSDCHLIEGYFETPLERYLPGIVPKIAQQAHFQALFPLQWQRPDCKPVCLHLAGTGDHFFWRRRNLMVKPLIKEAGIGGIILENPFYGLRKPIDQVRSSLHNVSDIFVMGGCLILESLVLFNWCERNGFGPLGVTGLSMGGHMASLAATNWPKPLVLVPCLSWSTASAVFLQGVMSHSINWDLLEDQYLADVEYREKLAKMVTVVDEAFLAGKKFARTFSEKVETTVNTDTSKPPGVKEKQSQTFEGNRKQSKTKAVDSNQSKKIAVKSKLSQVTNTNQQYKTNCPAKITKEINYTMSTKEATKDSRPEISVTFKNNNKEITRKDLETHIEDYIKKRNIEVKKLLDDKKISQSLYQKLTSNDKFELDLEDIDYLIKCKLVSTKVSESQTTREENKTLSPKEMLLAEITNSNNTNINEDRRSDLEKISLAVKPLPDTEKIKKSQIFMENTHPIKDKTKESSPVKDDKEKKKKTWNVTITPDWLTSFSFTKSKSEKKIDISKIHWRDRETLQFMRGIMDECTHLSNFTVPFDTSLIIAVCAKHDAYVPRDDTGRLEEIWPGAEVRYVDAGHVSAYILHQSLFRSCIVEAFERSIKRWKDGKHVD